MIYPIAIPGPDAVAPSEEELALARERKAAEEAKRAAIRAERARMQAERDAIAEANRVREHEAKVLPFKRFAETLAARLGSDLPQFADDLRRCDIKEVTLHLQEIVARQKQAEARAAAAAERDALLAAHNERHRKAAEEAEWRGLVT